jgi:hypothetical protein
MKSDLRACLHEPSGPTQPSDRTGRSASSFRNMTIIPLSIDGSIPQGFLNHIQSTKIDPAAPTYRDVSPGLARHDVSFLIDAIISIIGGSRSYRAAELHFQMILPYILRATDAQRAKRLTVPASNEQVCNAAMCAQTYLPPLFAGQGHLLDATMKKKLADTLARYAKKTP